MHERQRKRHRDRERQRERERETEHAPSDLRVASADEFDAGGGAMEEEEL